MKKKQFKPTDVKKIAILAKIPVTDEEVKKLADGFNTTLEVVDTLFTVDVAGVPPTHQVTGLENVFREDEIDIAQTLTQDQALANAPKSYNGYFVVEQIIDQE